MCSKRRGPLGKCDLLVAVVDGDSGGVGLGFDLLVVIVVAVLRSCFSSVLLLVFVVAPS